MSRTIRIELDISDDLFRDKDEEGIKKELGEAAYVLAFHVLNDTELDTNGGKTEPRPPEGQAPWLHL